jgi:hypothetical protein
MTGSNRLRAEYAGVDEALPDELLANEGTLTLHLPAADGEGPECNGYGESGWRLVDVDGALAYGAELCLNCFSMYLEHLARDPSSPVERAAGDGVTASYERVDVVARADGGDVRLTALTDRVARVTGSSTTFHAPTPSGALCGADVNKIDERGNLPQYRPCESCFDVETED